MSALIHSLDNYTPMQTGTNGHAEYTWSHQLQEKILQFSFQLTRTNAQGIQALQLVLKELLTTITYNLTPRACLSSEQQEKTIKEATHQLCVLYKLIGQCRDITHGKGEYALSYMMIYTWNMFYPELAKFAFTCFFTLKDKEGHPYGSWKDVKYFCEYCKKQGDDMELIQYAVNQLNEQLKLDYSNIEHTKNKTKTLSLAAKWAPRENSKFGWLFDLLAVDYFPHIMKTAQSTDSRARALMKCRTNYRKMLSELNRALETPQIKQCSANWADIQFPKVTSITLYKQKKAFLNKKKDGTQRYPFSEDRNTCSEHFKEFVQQESTSGSIKGKCVGMADFTKQALTIIKDAKYTCATNKDDIIIEQTLINEQWKNNATQTTSLGNMVAMVDVSGSMNGDPLYAAIALGIRIAEKSLLGKRVMTFSNDPKWVNLEPYGDFISQVEHLHTAEWGRNTNFYAAFNMMLNAIVSAKMPPSEVENMVLVILSDMQMDEGDSCNKQTLYESMKQKYAAAGLAVHGVPYSLPHMVFWNLRQTSGFPTCSSTPNASMMSGFSPSLLNLFCEQGITTLQSMTPWSMLMKSLENERYQPLEDYIRRFLKVGIKRL